MCGDVNLFIQEEGQGEIEVMIAEESSRRKGIASESILLLEKYANENLKIKKFVAHIIEENDQSLEMFLKLGYQKVSFNSIFKEHLLEKEYF